MVVASYSETLRILRNMNFNVPLYETGLYRTPKTIGGILQFPVQLIFLGGFLPPVEGFSLRRREKSRFLPALYYSYRRVDREARGNHCHT